MKTKLLLSVFIIILSITSVSAQEYKSSLGMRVGLLNGITFKQFVGEKLAFEALVSYRYSALNLSALLEYHIPVKEENFNMIMGLGGRVGYMGIIDDDQESAFNGGIEAMLGFEYKFPKSPFTIGIDWKPILYIGELTGFNADEVGLSIRYTF